jgi:hypothetical protein
MMPGATEEKDRELEREKANACYEIHGNRPQAAIEIRNLRVNLVTIGMNTISKSSGRAGILIQNVKASSVSMKAPSKNTPATAKEARKMLEKCMGSLDRVFVSENHIVDVTNGVALKLDSSTVTVKSNQIKKC